MPFAPGTNISHKQGVGRKMDTKKEILPKVVQLGGTLPTRFAREDTIWTPVIPERKVMTSKQEHETNANDNKCRRYKNMYEYNKRYNKTFDFKNKMWKIPSLGNNFLPFQSKSPHSSSEEVVGLYRPKFQRWYSRLVHEDTIVLPPIETSERVKSNVYEPTTFNEKKYIAEEYTKTGARERFTRDELFIPNVYNQCFTCRECRKEYANDVFNQTWTFRNSDSPAQHANAGSEKRARLKRQHCDVLGERYCMSCIEKRNKSFSLQIEDKLINNNDIKKVHYKSSLF